MQPRETIELFDAHLADRGLAFEAVVVGGAASAFADGRRAHGEALDNDWLNDGPASLAALLPPFWLERTEVIFVGRAIRLVSLGRLDLLRSKVFALCDRGIDLGDCIALAPTSDELDAVLPWLEAQDANEEWPAHARAVLDDLRQRLGHGA